MRMQVWVCAWRCNVNLHHLIAISRANERAGTQQELLRSRCACAIERACECASFLCFVFAIVAVSGANEHEVRSAAPQQVFSMGWCACACVQIRIFSLFSLLLWLTSLPSAGRMNKRLGVPRHNKNFSMGWCVGPSSPRLICKCYRILEIIRGTCDKAQRVCVRNVRLHITYTCGGNQTIPNFYHEWYFADAMKQKLRVRACLSACVRTYKCVCIQNSKIKKNIMRLMISWVMM